MSEIKILVEGYVRKFQGSIFASSTAVLIRNERTNIVVDPGMDRNLLLKALRNERISVGDVDYVVLTHYHLDHSLLAGIFNNAKILDNDEIYSWNGKIEKHKGKIPGTHIKIINTPGHDFFHCSILVDTVKFGMVAIVGDVFWWRDDEEQKTDKESLMKHADPFVKDKNELRKSREKILKIADCVIPGHGKMFVVDS